MNDDMNELRNIIQRLELMSHTSAAATDAHAAGKPTGGNRPPGGTTDRDGGDGFMLLSADHYRRRARGCRTAKDVRLVLEDARRTLKAWTHAPRTGDPEWGSFEWRRQIAREVQSGERSLADAKRFYEVSESTIRRYVKAYGD